MNWEQLLQPNRFRNKDRNRNHLEEFQYDYSKIIFFHIRCFQKPKFKEKVNVRA